RRAEPGCRGDGGSSICEEGVSRTIQGGRASGRRRFGSRPEKGGIRGWPGLSGREVSDQETEDRGQEGVREVGCSRAQS
ncbi:unnamed protein product, partial [Musa hybrid cultivar]